MWFGTDADDAEQFVLGLLGWMLEDLDDNGRARALEALRSTIAADETPDGVIFDSAIWIIRATRRHDGPGRHEPMSYFAVIREAGPRGQTGKAHSSSQPSTTTRHS